MDAKPGDFFIDVENFFSILLPGALATFLLSHCWWPTLADIWSLPLTLTLSDVPIGLGFIFLSYATGHLVAALGSLLEMEFLQRIYEDFDFRNHTRRHLFRDKVAGVLKNLEMESDEKKKYCYGVRHLKWAETFVSLKNPEAAATLSRIKADARFLRNLIPVIALSCIVTLMEVYEKYGYSIIWRNFLFIHLVILTALLIRCIALHIRHRDAAFRFLIMLNNSKIFP